MKHCFLFACLLIALSANAQTSLSKTAKTHGPAKQLKDQKPHAEYDYNKYIIDNVHYPGKELKKSKQGRVVVKFVVNEKGRITNCEVVQKLGKKYDAEALRVVKSMPPWKPEIKNGKPVKVLFKLPIVFNIRG
jgi:TonB family protein